QNRFENLRDPSHTAAFSLSALLKLFAEAGLELEHVSTGHLHQVVERWMANAQTPAERAAEVRRLIEQHAHSDLTGTRPCQTNEGAWCSTQPPAAVVGRKLKATVVFTPSPRGRGQG